MFWFCWMAVLGIHVVVKKLRMIRIPHFSCFVEVWM